MNKKQVLRTLFALTATTLLWTGCSDNGTLTPPDETPKVPIEPETATISFNLGIPTGDEVDFAKDRAAGEVLQDGTEWTLKTLKVYHFKKGAEESNGDTDYKLVNAYKIPVLESGDPASGLCVKTDDAKYSLRLSLRTALDGTHAFAFVANDSCSTFDENLVLEGTTLVDLKKCVADKQLATDKKDASLFMGDPAGLCMTCILDNQTLQAGENTSQDVKLTRIMARLDIRNFVPENRNFQLKSLKVTYTNTVGATKGYLFQNVNDAGGLTIASGGSNIWTNPQVMEVTQNPIYEGKYTTYAKADAEMRDSWISICSDNNRTGVWYKKVLYMYEFPKTINGISTAAPMAEIAYTLNGSPSTVEVPMKETRADGSAVLIDIKRNHLYTLQIGETSAQGGPIVFSFTDTPWSIHEMDADLNEGTNSDKVD